MRRVVWTVATAMLAVQGAAVDPDVAGAQASRIEVDGAWTTVLPPVVKSAELYMVIRNAGEAADRLVGARSSACGRVQVYESTHAAMSGHSGMGKQSGMGEPNRSNVAHLAPATRRKRQTARAHRSLRCARSATGGFSAGLLLRLFRWATSWRERA